MSCCANWLNRLTLKVQELYLPYGCVTELDYAGTYKGDVEVVYNSSGEVAPQVGRLSVKEDLEVEHVDNAANLYVASTSGFQLYPLVGGDVVFRNKGGKVKDSTLTLYRYQNFDGEVTAGITYTLKPTKVDKDGLVIEMRGNIHGELDWFTLEDVYYSGNAFYTRV